MQKSNPLESLSMFPSGMVGVLSLTEGISGARDEGPKCKTEILINRRLLSLNFRSDAFHEERLEGGWVLILCFLACFVPWLVNIYTFICIGDVILFNFAGKECTGHSSGQPVLVDSA